MSHSDPTEQELKIPVADLEPVRARLAAAGAERKTASAREVNLLYDQSGELTRSGRVLRLRRWAGRWILTFKGPAEYDGAVKSRTELELELSDGAVLGRILECLGYETVRRYEKDREQWRLEEVEVTLDHTPMGDFVELEGPSATLAAAAVRLGLQPADAVRGSYVSLWAEHRAAHPELGLPPDMVFAP